MSNKLKASSLRIGNLVMDQNKMVQVKEIKEYGISFIDKPLVNYLTTASYSLFAPIPLTEEILLKCGAEKYAKRKISIQGIIDINTINNSFNYGVYGSRKFGKMKYLHELQNLYFSLTHQELEIKL